MTTNCAIGGSFTTIGSYGQCCYGSDCRLPVSCNGNTLVYPFSSYDCAQYSSYVGTLKAYTNCVVDRVYDYLNETKYVSRLGCSPRTASLTYFRHNPEREPHPPGSRSWIAGAVLGPLALIGLVKTVLICLRRRKERKRAARSVPFTVTPLAQGSTLDASATAVQGKVATSSPETAASSIGQPPPYDVSQHEITTDVRKF